MTHSPTKMTPYPPTCSLPLHSESSESKHLKISLHVKSPMKTYLQTSLLFILVHFTFLSMGRVCNNSVIIYEQGLPAYM